MKLQSLLSISVACFVITACNKSKSVATHDPAESIIQGLESSTQWAQLDALEAVRQTTDTALLARLKDKVEAVAVSPSAQTLATRKAGTLLFQKYGQVDPRHAVAYTHLLLDDPSMANALLKSATIDKAATIQAIEAKEKQILQISSGNLRMSDQQASKRLLTEFQTLKNLIGK